MSMKAAPWATIQRALEVRGFDPGKIDGDPRRLTWSALFRCMGAKEAADALGRGAAETFQSYHVDTPLRIAHWLAQFGHESRNFTRFEESLHYSTAERLCQVWPSRFRRIADALPFVANPQALAERVYGRRADLGNHQDGDGWRFIGRGPGLTGRVNYASCAARTGLPLIDHPELASEPEHFPRIACDFWNTACCNLAADRDDIEGVTRKINGGLIGLEQRRLLLAKAKKVLVP